MESDDLTVEMFPSLKPEKTNNDTEVVNLVPFVIPTMEYILHEWTGYHS